jgi:hypothetical protein
MIESKTSDLRKRTIEQKQNKRPKEKTSEKDKKSWTVLRVKLY